MSFDNIKLPVTVLAEIYKDNLVQITRKGPDKNAKILESVTTTTGNPPQFLGQNLKNILVLVHYPDMAYLPEQQLDFLIKILIACKLDIGDIAIINTAKQQANLEHASMLHAKSILLFGKCVSNVLQNKEIDFFIPLQNDNLSIMTAPALEDLSGNNTESKQLKSKLWGSLQQFFDL